MPALKKKSFFRRLTSFRMNGRTPDVGESTDVTTTTTSSGRRQSRAASVWTYNAETELHPLEIDVVAVNLMTYLPMPDLHSARLVCQSWSLHASNEILERVASGQGRARSSQLQLCDHDFDVADFPASAPACHARRNDPDYVGTPHVTLSAFVRRLAQPSGRRFTLRLLSRLHLAVQFTSLRADGDVMRLFTVYYAHLTRVNIRQVSTAAGWGACGYGHEAVQREKDTNAACMFLLGNWTRYFPNCVEFTFHELPCLVKGAGSRPDGKRACVTKLRTLSLDVNCADCPCRRVTGSSESLDLPPPVPSLGRVNSILYSLILDSPKLNRLTLNFDSSRFGATEYLILLLGSSNLAGLQYLKLHSTRADEVTLPEIGYTPPYALLSLSMANLYFGEESFARLIRPHFGSLQHLRYVHEESVFFPNVLLPEELPILPVLRQLEVSTSPFTGLASVNFANSEDLPSLEELVIRDIGGVFELHEMGSEVPEEGFPNLKRLTVGFRPSFTTTQEEEYLYHVGHNFEDFLHICPNLTHLYLENPPPSLLTCLWKTQNVTKLKRLELNFCKEQSICLDKVITGFKKPPSNRKVLKGLKNLCKVMTSTRTATATADVGGPPEEVNVEDDNALVLRSTCKFLVDKWLRKSSRRYRASGAQAPSSVASLHNLKKLVISCDAYRHEFSIFSIVFLLSISGLKSAVFGSYSLKPFDKELLQKINEAMEGTSIAIDRKSTGATTTLNWK